MNLEVNRRLQVWSFGVSHRELVLMSTHEAGEYPTRFCALLKPVSFITLPTSFDCIRVADTLSGGTRRFEFFTSDHTYFVVADHLFHAEDRLPWHAPLPFGVNQ